MKRAIFIFKIYYLLYVLVAFTAMLNGYAWLEAATMILTIFGSVILLFMVIRWKDYFRGTTNSLWVILFLGSHVFSSLMTVEYGITGNIKEIFWLAFPMLILYVGSWQCTKEEVQTEMRVLSFIYVTYSTIASAVSLSMLFWGREYQLVDANGGIRVIGFKWGRLWGVFDDPNHGATIVVAGVVLTMYLFLISRSKVVKSGCSMAILIQYMYIVFSDSRTGEIMLITAIVIGGGIGVFQMLQNKKNAARLLLSCLTVCILSAAVVGSSYGIRDIYNQAEKAKQSNPNQIKKPSQVGRKQDLEKDMSNGRLSIWESGVEITKTSPVYGVSFRNMTEYAKKNTPDTYLVNTPGGEPYDSLHNVAMDILVSQGMIGILIVAAMVVNTILCLKRKWRYKERESFVLQVSSFVVVASLGVGSMFLTMVFYLNSPQTYIFWLCFGYLMVLVSDRKKHI